MKRIVALLLFSAPVWGAHQTPLSTDRPSFSNCSLTVGESTYQLETGLVKQTLRDSSGTRGTAWQIPVLLRAGLGETFELRLQSNGYTWQRSDGNRSEGLADLDFGFKKHLQDQRLWRPAYGLIMSGEFATGARVFKGRGFQPTLELPLDWNLPRNFSCTVMPGAGYAASDSYGKLGYGILSSLVDYIWTARFQTFVEWAGQQFATPSNGGSQESADFGFTFLSAPNLQLDGAMGWGLTRQTAPAFWTLGISTRFP